MRTRIGLEPVDEPAGSREEEMGRLDGKVALVSGGARGMGEAHCRFLANEGASVAVCDVIDEEAEAVAAAIGEAAIALHLDVTSEADWATAVSATQQAFGKLDVLVNNAGITAIAPLEEMTLAQYRDVTEVNQTGVFLGMKAVIAPMKAAGGGSIINVSSIDGLVGMNLVMGYLASKWAVRGMTRGAAMELAPHRIRVNSVHPGFIHTRMGNPDGVPEARGFLDAWAREAIPIGRAGEPEDIAQLVVFLASDESSYSTGSEFVADGGLISGYSLPGS
jgi:3alpha(or 20beta)-hydroxysteroid dehydrogenase